MSMIFSSDKDEARRIAEEDGYSLSKKSDNYHKDSIESTQWYIWSCEHQSWWKPNQLGYCYDRKNAGIYSYAEACEIVREANKCDTNTPQETMVPFCGQEKS